MHPFLPKQHPSQPIILGQQWIDPSQHPRHPNRSPRPCHHPSQHPRISILCSSCAISTTLLLWNQHLHVQLPTTKHSPNTPVYFSLGPQRVPTPQSRTTLSASRKLYSIWLADHILHQQPQIVDTPQLVASNPSYTKYPEETLPKKTYHPKHPHPYQLHPRYPHFHTKLLQFIHLWQHLYQSLSHLHLVLTPVPQT